MVDWRCFVSLWVTGCFRRAGRVAVLVWKVVVVDADVRAAATLLARFSDEMTAIVDEAMGTDFADNGEIRVLLAIQRQLPPSTADLAELSRMNRRAVSRFVSWLETAGLATVGRSARDGRVVLVSGTALARRRGKHLRLQFDLLLDRSQALAAEVVSLLGGGTDQSGIPPRRDPLEVLDALASVGLDISAGAALRGDAGRMPPRHRVALTRIASHPELRPTQLVDILGLTSGGVTYLVDQLAAAGYVQRRYGNLDSDRRAVTLTITPSGMAAVSGVYQGVDAARSLLSAVFQEIKDRSPIPDGAPISTG